MGDVSSPIWARGSPRKEMLRAQGHLQGCCLGSAQLNEKPRVRDGPTCGPPETMAGHSPSPLVHGQGPENRRHEVSPWPSVLVGQQ